MRQCTHQTTVLRLINLTLNHFTLSSEIWNPLSLGLSLLYPLRVKNLLSLPVLHALNLATRFIFAPCSKTSPPQERYQMVKSQHRCFSCLGNHVISNCKSKYSCVKCQKNITPYYMKIFENMEPSNSTAAFSTPCTLNTGESTFAGGSADFSQPQHNSTILLATVLVRLVTKHGNSQVFRALLDSCGQCDSISERAAQLLGVERHK